MKKFVVFSVVALAALASCTKVEVNNNLEQKAISFQTANYTTKVTGSEFPNTETFGTYAWTAGTTGEYFIENKEVAFDGTQWTTATPYYWPKNQTVDFFSYYPYNATGAVPVVSKDSIKYNAVNFTTTQLDIMYADKAVGYTDNANQVEDVVNAYEGVPTFFRHAGCKVKVNVILGENEKTEGDGTITKWDVTLKSVMLSGIYVKGDCKLTLSSTDNGIIPWTKPVVTVSDTSIVAAPVDVNVWAADTSLVNDVNNTLYTDVQERILVKNQGQTVIGTSIGNDQYDGVYMLPQVLVPGKQKITLTCKVTTYRKAPGATDFVQTLVQDNVVVSANLLIKDVNNPIYAWQMNQNIVYNITIGPAGKQITFDPAVDAWENKTVATNIELEI